ncbi:sodium:proton antiporter, partial [Candidatus Atribacteria bacterium HGW-Atribacteria-1]
MKEMSRIVRTVTNFVYGFIIIFGFYIIVHGHLTPGGGFQGGAVVGSAFALLLVS